VDELIKVSIKLYFPTARILSEQQYETMSSKDLLCTVEVTHYGDSSRMAKDSATVGLREQGLVRHMRLITIQDKNTLEWVTFKKLGKKVIQEIQKALCSEICEKLQLRTQRGDPTKIVPRDILIT
jgi:hypothetical protein